MFHPKELREEHTTGPEGRREFKLAPKPAALQNSTYWEIEPELTNRWEIPRRRRARVGARLSSCGLDRGDVRVKIFFNKGI